MKKSQLKQLIREVIEEAQMSEIDRVIQDKSSGQWNISEPGIKVFFDITRFNVSPIVFDILGKMGLRKLVDKIPQSIKSKINPDQQTSFGSGIQIINKLIHGDLEGANHAGFILSNGQILDAVTQGVGYRDGTEIRENPQNYIIFNLGGSEEKLKSAYEELKKIIKSYDKPGIARQIRQKFPKLWNLVARFKNVEKKFKETGQEEFFCSEFVANLLARVGIVSVDELVKANVNEELTALDHADELDPVQLYRLIKTKAKLVDIVSNK